MNADRAPFDVSSWKRYETYEYFSGISDPFYSVCFNLDVTELKEYTHSHGLSFYYAMVKLVTDAFNEVPAFLLTVQDGVISKLFRREPSFTDRRKGEEYFYIVTLTADGTLEDFCSKAKRASASQIGFINSELESDALIYISCMPTLELTAVTNERDFDRDDCIPRITWGKYFLRGDRLMINISLEVTHRFIDGFHIGEFARILREKIQALAGPEEL